MRVFIAVFFLVISLYGSDIVIEPSTENYLVTPHISYLEDQAGTLDIETVRSESVAGRFIPSASRRVSLGVTGSDFWAKVTVDNRGEQRHWLLVSNQIWLKRFELYYHDGTGWKKKAISALAPYETRGIKNRKLILPFELPAHGESTLYVKIAGNVPSFDLQMATPQEFIKSNQDGVAYDLLLFGIVLAMIIYNGSLAAILKSRIYLYYVFYLASISFYIFINKGYAYEFLWPEAGDFNYVIDIFFVGTGTIFLGLFADRFLMLRERHSRLYRVIMVFVAINMLTCLNFMANPVAWSVLLINVFYILGPLLFLGTAIFVLYRGYRPARLYLLGYSILNIFVLLTILDMFGVIAWEFASAYGVHLGVAIEAMVFSYALADRISIMHQRESELVVENLKKDQLLLKQSQKALMGEMIGVIAHQWKKPLYAISIDCNEIGDVYRRGELDEGYIGRFDDRIQKYIRYMSRTMDDFRNFFNPNKERKPFPLSDACEKSMAILQKSFIRNGIDVQVDIPDVTVFGLETELQQVFLNLLNNAVDALKDQELPDRTIKVSAYGEGGKMLVSVCDNGGGIAESVMGSIYDPYFTTKGEEGTGTGLYLVKLVVESSFGGSIRAENREDGVCFILTLPSGEGAES